MTNCPAKVAIVDSEDNVFECPGRFYFDGKILCIHEGQRLLVDPEWYHKKDPKRLMIYNAGKWSRFRVKSVLLDSKAVIQLAEKKKTSKNTR